ncbi:MAG: TonB-dependent receptor plug domain-containing protein, partial [Aeromonas sp.]
MQKSFIWMVCSALCCGNAYAEEAVDLGALELHSAAARAEASAQPSTTAPSGYESFDLLDTGRSVLAADTLAENHQGGSDTTALIQSLPFVQMDTERQAGTAEAAQSLRPSDFSISGGNIYDNAILIDGVSASSIMDVSKASKNDFNEVFGQTAQSLYVDPSLLGSMEVLDSNISARYGDFTGGVVEMKLREP